MGKKKHDGNINGSVISLDDTKEEKPKLKGESMYIVNSGSLHFELIYFLVDGNFLSQLTFWWVNGIIFRGYKHPLEVC